MTPLKTVRFNPYWNAPASIVEKDILPRMLSSGPSKIMREMNMKIFDGVGGPEVDPDSVNWRRAVVDNYHFRQEPGGSNAMATAKIEFNSPFGIYLHDTPEPQLFQTGQRFYSSGCVRVEKVAILINWILQGQDGIDQNRIAELAKTKERLDEEIANPPQLRVAYLTAWPTRDGVAALNQEAAFDPLIARRNWRPHVLTMPIPLNGLRCWANTAARLEPLRLKCRTVNYT
jgi:murein L,D-transpeptidase YcbB/YkuD